MWRRCIRVDFDGDTVSWELSPTGKYDLLTAYEKQPHRQLIKATDDRGLKNFVRAWGPLTFGIGGDARRASLASIRRDRDFFRAWINLIDAINAPANPVEALIAFLKLSPDPYAIKVRSMLELSARAEDKLDDDCYQKLLNSPRSRIYNICRFVLGANSAPSPTFDIHETGNGAVVRANLGINSLIDALRWMVYQDVFTEKPIQFCAECGNLIDTNTKHKRKFCGAVCAQRVSSRNWQRKDRRRSKQVPLKQVNKKVKKEGIQDGTHKAR